MHASLTDSGIAAPRLSPGVLAAVVLVHAALIGATLLFPRHAEPPAAPPPLFVRLIDAPAATRPAEPAPPPPAIAPPPPPAPAVPKRAAPEPAPRPEPTRDVKTPVQAEPPRTAAAPASAPPVPAPVTAPVSTPAPSPAPTAAVAETPRPTPPAPVTQPRFNADYLDNPKPAYPSVSRRMGEEGEVRLKVAVDTEGRAREVVVHQSSGFARLDQAAVDTVRQWRFVPARQGDQPVAASVIVPIQFKLGS